MAKKKNQYDQHHRKPRSLGGSTTENNLSTVRKSHHQHWHGIFGNMTAEQIIRYINAKWIDPDYVVVLYRKQQN